MIAANNKKLGQPRTDGERLQAYIFSLQIHDRSRSRSDGDRRSNGQVGWRSSFHDSLALDERRSRRCTGSQGGATRKRLPGQRETLRLVIVHRRLPKNEQTFDKKNFLIRNFQCLPIDGSAALIVGKIRWDDGEAPLGQGLRQHR